jgi:hypothetical protein
MIEQASNRLSMKEAAEYLGRSYSWMWANHRSVGLNGYQIGGRWFFDLRDIQLWEATLKPFEIYSEPTSTLKKSSSRAVQFI